MTAKLSALQTQLVRVILRHVEPIFKDGVRVTLIVRTPGDNEADVLVSNDTDLDEITAVIERSKSREVMQTV